MSITTNLSPKDPRIVLLELGKLKGQGKVLPKVLIDTAEGHRYSGNVLGVEEAADGFFVLFESERSSSASSAPLTYLSLAHGRPFHLSFLEPENALTFLRFGQVPRWSTDAALPSLQAKRQLEEISAKFKAQNVALAIDDGFVFEGQNGNSIRDVLQELLNFWGETAKDALGAAALQKIKSVVLKPAPQKDLYVENKADALVVNFDPSVGLIPKEKFVAKLNSIL